MKASNVRPISDLKNRAKELIHEVATTGQTVVITQNGKPRSVLMDVKVYDRLREALAMLKVLAQSQESLTGGRAHSTANVRAAARSVLKRARRNG